MCIRDSYEAIDHVLAVESKKEPLHFEPISMEEITVAQNSDNFCTDISRRLNEGVVLPFSHDENVSRSRVVLAPKGPSSEQLLEATRPMTIHEVIADFPAP